MIEMVGGLLELLEWAIGAYLVYRFFSDLSKLHKKNMERNEPKDPATVEFPLIFVSEVPYKDTKIYLVDDIRTGQFIGQGPSADDVLALLKQKFSDKKFYLVAPDGKSATLINYAKD